MSYVVGIDGGGTKTVAAVATLDGEIVATGTAGPSNVATLGVAKARAAVESAFFSALRACGASRRDVMAVCLGLAGLDSPRVLRRVRGAARFWRVGPSARVEQDSTIALAAATRLEEPGVVVIAGTGSVVMGTDGAGRIVKVGGWGYILNDEGSAFHIGLEGLRAVSKSFDGRLPRTRLMRYVLSEMGVRDFYGLLEKVYSEELSPAAVAALAPAVTRAASEGDRVALTVVRSAAAGLAAMVTTALRRLRLREATVYYTGGVFASELFLRLFEGFVRRRSPRVSVERLGLQPVVGAVYLALRQAGVELGEYVLNQVRESAERLGLAQG